MLKGSRHSSATLEKQRLAKLGKKRPPRSKEWRAKISARMKKVPPLMLGKKHKEETKLKIGRAHIGNKHNLGKQRSIEVRLKTSREKNSNWKGGITPVNEAIRKSTEYRLWRESVFKRDKWTCVWCGQVGGVIHADHIKPFALYPELRFSIDNGRTLCKPCHMTTDTWGGGTNKRK